MSTPTRDFVEGVAALFVAADLGVYRPAGPGYAATETGIALNGLTDSPDRQYGLTAYGPGGDDQDLPLDLFAIQVRVRGDTDPRTEMDMRDGMHAVLQGRRHAVFGSVTAIQLRRVSLFPPAQDESGRWESTSNYYTVTDMPATANRFLSQ